jgi:hypothetical protein
LGAFRGDCGFFSYRSREVKRIVSISLVVLSLACVWDSGREIASKYASMRVAMDPDTAVLEVPGITFEEVMAAMKHKNKRNVRNLRALFDGYEHKKKASALIPPVPTISPAPD